MENIRGMCVYVQEFVFLSSETVCVPVHGENVEYKSLPVLSNIGLVMLCRLFFFCSPLTKIDFWNTFIEDKETSPTTKGVCAACYTEQYFTRTWTQTLSTQSS